MAVAFHCVQTKDDFIGSATMDVTAIVNGTALKGKAVAGVALEAVLCRVKGKPNCGTLFMSARVVYSTSAGGSGGGAGSGGDGGDIFAAAAGSAGR